MLDYGAISLELGTMLTQLIVFIILLLAVRKFAMGPIMAVMEKRRQHIENEIATAERSRQEAEALLAEQRRVLDEARSESKAILDRAAKQASDEAARIIAEAQATAERLKADASADIAREVEKAKAELRDQMAGLSVLLASKIIEKELDEAAQKEAVDKFLAQVGERL
ncbi:F0F1 ATP synthase subunit B [Brevibacillus sp. SYP-B805]|uniref:F0F1 ATP synthase subunit B n=1 Tax=Brevibacillus sp. SYP-B805 TaxID=1578199 RepID=UPI0013EBC733|nr:F0F1 ATP synthase subunit B [Brevibacillus sp. SYP-B805]NGQ95558.1 F0F1 ATP synthase subunit B [Brevibacillus sp. SYP-B805]